MMSAANITMDMLRRGEPAALAVLCQRRGPAVFAYCAQVAGRDRAMEAAADAFAQFRLAVQPAGAVSDGRQADALLRRVTRSAALSRGADTPNGRVGGPSAERCEGRESELLSYVDDALTRADRELFAAHLARCHSCTAALQRLGAAEPAFSTSSRVSLPQPVAAAILTALANAAPVAAHEGDAAAVRDEALLLLTAADLAADPPAPPVHSAPPTPVTPPSLAATPVPAVPRPPGPPDPPDPTPPAPQPDLLPVPSAKTNRGMRLRLRPHRPWSDDAGMRQGRSAALLRGAAKFVAVIAVAAAAGLLLGIALSELT